jgi:metallophosphoesterase (TIGR03767 family)
MRIRTRRAVAALAVATAVTAAAPAGLQAASPTGFTTEERTVVAGGPLDPAKPGFLTMQQGSGWERVTRELVAGQAQAGRETRRRSLAYFAQLTDFQLADEESPARVEFADETASGAWRPEEALGPFTVDADFRQLNAFTSASPVAQAGGTRAQMDFALSTGDNADNKQWNENVWVRQLLEGGTALSPNSGVKSNYESCSSTSAAALKAKEFFGQLPNEPIYTGVQDFNDQEANTEDFYDPNQPQGQFAEWPRYTGLMDRAQQTFTPVGLRRGTTAVPSYVANGNHDGLVQGNQAATSEIEGIALGCFKPLVPGGFDFRSIIGSGVGAFVRPDPARRFVDKAQLKAVYGEGTQRDAHGFGFVESRQNRASRGTASYYSWDPKPGVHFIGLDTISEGGVIAASAEGNLDDPQYQWLAGDIATAEAAGKLIVVFAHHPIRSLTANVSDETAPRCTRNDSHGHDVNPGCDADPRTSTPIHLGADVQGLFNAHPHVIAYVTGHTHENRVMACGAEAGCPARANWWEVNTASEIDWPQESRLIELMENADGTLSLFGTLVDHAAAYELPSPGSNASAFSVDQLGSLSRAFSYNDPQSSHGAIGAAQDRNVELLLDDPRS